MEFRLFIFQIIFIAAFPPSFCFFPSLSGVVKNEENKVSNIVGDGGVRSMQIKNPFSSMMLQGHPVGNVVQQRRVQNGFNWTSCASSKSPIMEIKKLMLKPSPLSIPGILTFGFDIVFHDNIVESDNVTAQLKIQYKAGSVWLLLPCLGGLGSCTYTDLCSQISGLVCPPVFKDSNIPCHCPFNKGEYKLRDYSIEIDAEVFVTGDYRATIEVSSTAKKEIACYKVSFTID